MFLLGAVNVATQKPSYAQTEIEKYIYIFVRVNSLSIIPEVSPCFVGPTVIRGALRAPMDCVKACISTDGP